MSAPPPPPSRPWYVPAAIGGAVAVGLCVIISLVVVNLPSGNDAAQNSAATEAPQTPDYPEFESPPATETTKEPTASPTPRRKKILRDGDQKPDYTTFPAVNPGAYDCPDGRNNGVNEQDLVPCINGSLRLELNSPNGTITLYSSTTRTASVEAKVSDKADAPQPGVTGVDWVIRQSTFSNDGQGEFYRLRYFSNPDLQPYGVYYRPRGIGSWILLENPNNQKFYANTYYQVVVFWNDPEAPEGEAPLPPNFAWGSVEKPFSS